MTDLSDLYFDPTIHAMKMIAEGRRAAEPRRNYLGASQIGDPCERKIWYEFNGHPRNPMGWQGCFAVEDGYRTEELVIERLRQVPGIKVYGVQDGFSALDDFFQGHIDGKIEGLWQAPKTPHILEVKACNEKKFRELEKAIDKHGEKDALKHWSVWFYAQAQTYMFQLGFERHYLVCSLPGGRDMISCRTELDKEYAKAMLGRAKRIIEAREPPERAYKDKSFFACSFCDFKDECWG